MSERTRRYAHLPAVLARRTKQGNDIFTGVVVDAKSATARVYCGHHHRFEDMAMTCARRLKAKRALSLEDKDPSQG